MKHKANKTILAAIVIVLLLFGVGQYNDYLSLPKARNSTTVPVNGVNDLSINWRYYSIPYDHIESNEDLSKNVEITVSPEYKYKVYMASQKDLYLQSIDKDKTRLEQEAQGRFQEFVGSYYPSDKRLTVERIGGSYKPNTTYKITVTNQPFNIFYHLLGTKSKTFTFTTGIDTEDELISRAKKFESSLSTFLATVPTKEELKQQTKAKETCRLYGVLDNPEVKSLSGKYYEIGTLSCDTKNFAGESVTIKLLDPKGKQEFEQFLKDNKVDISKLKITYTN